MLWDKEEGTIVNNESSEIIRMFNTAFNDQLSSDKAALDLYPESLRKEIDDVNGWVYDTVNSTCCTASTFMLVLTIRQTAYTSPALPRPRRRTRPPSYLCSSRF